MANHSQMERDASETTRQAADQASQTSSTMSNAAEDASRAAGEAVRRNAETFSATWQSGSEAAGRLAEQSMEQFSNVLGLNSDDVRQSIPASVQALLVTSTGVTSGMQNVSGEWMRLVQNRFQENLKSFDEMMSCRTVHDYLVIQAQMARDNYEAFLQTAQRASELSTNALKQMSDAALAPR